jgi:allantoin racemase
MENGQNIRIRWINPLGIPDYDQSIADLICQIRNPNTWVDVVSFAMEASPHHLEYYAYEGLVASQIVQVTRDAAQNNFDGIVIGCFYDLGLREAQNISGEAVVTAPCLASLQTVSHLANRFSILVGQQSWVDQMEAKVREYGYGDSLASMRAVGLGVEEFQADPERTRRLMIAEAEKAVQEDHAEALILGCTIEYGFYSDLQKIIGVPVIDAVLAAFKTIEHAALVKRQFGWKPSRLWGCKPPPEEELQKWSIFKEPAPIGHKIEIDVPS